MAIDKQKNTIVNNSDTFASAKRAERGGEACVGAGSRGYCFFKRAADIILSGGALLLLLVPFAVIAAAIWIDDPGSVLFCHNRVGRNGKQFRLYKFRSMKKGTPRYRSTAELDDPDRYITRVGRFLRKTSLDELPQLINVFNGDMSLVGPRPLIPEEREIHRMREELGVYALRPGLTGLAQINGRDTVKPEDKVRWDVKYLESFGFLTDLKILLATIPKSVGGEDVVEGHVGTEEGEQSSDTRSE